MQIIVSFVICFAYLIVVPEWAISLLRFVGGRSALLHAFGDLLRLWLWTLCGLAGLRVFLGWLGRSFLAATFLVCVFLTIFFGDFFFVIIGFLGLLLLDCKCLISDIKRSRLLKSFSSKPKHHFL